MARSAKSYFAQQESLRCQLLRRRARESQSPMGRDIPTTKDQPNEPPPGTSSSQKFLKLLTEQ